MYLLDDDNQLIDAECSLGFLEGAQCIIVESSGGADPRRGLKRRNPEYNKLVGTLLSRLASANIKVARIVLDSKKVATLPVKDRVAVLDQPYPINLKTRGIDEFRRMLGRTVAKMHQDPNAKSGGNAQKRIRLCLGRVVSPDQLLTRLSGQPTADADADPAPALTETERDYVVKARKGQGRFRQTLLRRFEQRCPVTGIRNPDLLVASHIKPWWVCTNAERLDPANGILLSALADRLFDKGLMSFDADGTVLPSGDLSVGDKEGCGLADFEGVALPKQSERYMAYHRKYQFRP